MEMYLVDGSKYTLLMATQTLAVRLVDVGRWQINPYPEFPGDQDLKVDYPTTFQQLFRPRHAMLSPWTNIFCKIDAIITPKLFKFSGVQKLINWWCDTVYVETYRMLMAEYYHIKEDLFHRAERQDLLAKAGLLKYGEYRRGVC